MVAGLIVRLSTWVLDRRDLWNEIGAHQAQRKADQQVGVMATITYYGRLGEMGGSDDRADPDEWGHADTGSAA